MATNVSLHASQYQTGSRCPHQSWREMHHGLMLSSQSRYTRPQRSGWKRIWPVRTTSFAGSASSSMRMNHWSEISGSMRSPERCENGTVCV